MVASGIVMLGAKHAPPLAKTGRFGSRSLSAMWQEIVFVKVGFDEMESVPLSFGSASFVIRKGWRGSNSALQNSSGELWRH
jgi:hypothetical protein